MVRVDLVRDKIRRIRGTLAMLARVLPPDATGLTDRDKIDLVAFRVYLVVQECVDVASHVIADEGWGPAPSLRDHFAILEQRTVIDAALCSELSSAIKVRNVIAHGYADVDAAKLHEAATELKTLAERYCTTLLNWAEKRATG
jgi:uncharacterized protein YutE (UPF0331/DUF86 family)